MAKYAARALGDGRVEEQGAGNLGQPVIWLQEQRQQQEQQREAGPAPAPPGFERARRVIEEQQQPGNRQAVQGGRVNVEAQPQAQAEQGIGVRLARLDCPTGAGQHQRQAEQGLQVVVAELAEYHQVV